MRSGDENTKKRSSAWKIIFWCCIGYFLISALTLPFIGKVWFGEIPVLGLIQLPKVAVAKFFRKEVVMDLIRLLGFSSGSFSPDYIWRARMDWPSPIFFPVGSLLIFSTAIPEFRNGVLGSPCSFLRRSLTSLYRSFFYQAAVVSLCTEERQSFQKECAPAPVKPELAH